MRPFSLGRVNVATAGTPVALAAVHTPCCMIRVQVIAGLTGKMYLGVSLMDKATLAGVVKEFWPNAAGGVSDVIEIASQDGTNSLNLADYWLDAAVSGEGCIVSYWVR